MPISLNYASRANWTCRSGQCLESAAHQARPKAPSTGSLRSAETRNQSPSPDLCRGCNLQESDRSENKLFLLHPAIEREILPQSHILFLVSSIVPKSVLWW